MSPHSHELEVQSTGRRLDATLYLPTVTSEERPAVLFVHGLRSSRSGYESRAIAASTSLGAAALTFDLSGHGKSSDYASYSPRDHVDDVLAAYDYLQSVDGVEASRIGVCGASYGAYLSVLATSARAIARLLLRAPAVYADADYRRPLAERSTESAVDRAPTLFTTVAEYPGAVLVVESELDEEIPPEVIQAYLNANPHAKHKILRGAKHGLEKPEWDREFTRLLVDWFMPL